MGLFSNIFKTKEKRVVETQLGTFTLVYSKRNKNTWSKSSNDITLSIQGTETEPDRAQLKFLESINDEIQKIDPKITKRFIQLFKEADLNVDFTTWRERFKMAAIDVMLIFEGEGYWNITFEDLKEPFTQFTLYIEGQRLTDFSIDT